MDLIYLRFLSQKTLAELKSSQYPKKDPKLVPKWQQILRTTDENATLRDFHSISCRFFKWPPPWQA